MNRFRYQKGEQSNISGERIRELRLKNRLSQSTLAKRMQVRGAVLEQDAISRIERGARVVADYELLVLTEIFNVSSDYLIGREEAKRRGD